MVNNLNKYRDASKLVNRNKVNSLQVRLDLNYCTTIKVDFSFTTNKMAPMFRHNITMRLFRNVFKYNEN